jgi:hypothetical protein
MTTTAIVLTCIWVLLLSGIIWTSAKIMALLKSGKIMKVLNDAELIGDSDFVSDYPTFVIRYRVIRKAAKFPGPKWYGLKKHEIRLKREFEIMDKAFDKMKK